MRRALLVAAAITVASPAFAHDAPYSFLNLRFTKAGVEGALTAHVVDLAHESAVAAPESLLAPAAAASRGPALFGLLAQRFSIVADGDTLRLRFLVAAPDSERNGVTMRFAAATSRVPSEVAIDARLFPYDPQHETYVNAYVADSLRDQDLIDARHPRVAFETGAPPLAAVVRRFVATGIHHIFIGPDHILFVIGLLLLGGSLRRLLKIVTGFTVAHSITLALATLGWVTPSPRLIEPLIALSIVFIGIENIRALSRKGVTDRRALLAFCFGFVHGFGFASVLREFGLPQQALGVALFAFNVGVEIGQTTIVLASAPVLALVRRASTQASLRLTYAGSAIVGLAGLFWFIQRVI